ncbi:MAG: hypothetical protein JWN41_620 [Thermoleophilia bacterium]|nr:hypothetical protein [Thermoleophilia bacterium]
MDAPRKPPDGDSSVVDDLLSSIGTRFAAVVQPAPHPPVDVAAYLLDPPPSPADVERTERRRRFVCIGSLVAAVVVCAILLLPVREGRDHAPPAESPDMSVNVDSQGFPQRVDEPVASRRSSKRHAKRVPRTTRRGLSRQAALATAALQRGGSMRSSSSSAPRPAATVRPTLGASTARYPSRSTAAPVHRASPAVSGGGTRTAAPFVGAAVVTGETSSTDAPTPSDGVGTSGGT